MAQLDAVEFEHIEGALKGFALRSDLPERMAAWVAEVLFAQQTNPALQECLAGLLREEGWECTPPAVMAEA